MVSTMTTHDTSTLIITSSIQRFSNYLLLSTKQTSHSKSIEHLKAALQCLVKVLQSPTMDIFVSKKLILYLSFYYNDKSVEINLILIEIINKLLTEAFFDNLCDDLNTAVLFLNTIMRLTYQSRHLLIVELVIRKIHKYIDHLLTSTLTSIKNQMTQSIQFALNELKESFPIVNSYYYQTIDKEIIQMNLIQQCKEDKIEALRSIKSLFKNITMVSEQYEIIINHSSTIIKPLLDLNTKKHNIDELLKIGKFLKKFLFTNTFILDTSPNTNEVTIANNNILFIYDNKITNDLTKFKELNGKVYQCTYEYEILQLYPQIISIYRSYIKIISDFELNFNLQFLCYQLLKALYFIFPSYRIEFEEFIPKTLFALASFHNVTDWTQSLECREFAYHLLLHDKNIKGKIKSATSVPQMDITYTSVLLRDVNIPMGFMRKMTIDSGMIKSKDIEIYDVDSIIYVEVEMVEDTDITIKVIYFDDNEPSNQTEIAVAKKVNCFKNKMRIVVHVKEIGRYRIDFDNSYAWITLKSLYYRITILKPLISPDVDQDNGQTNTSITTNTP